MLINTHLQMTPLNTRHEITATDTNMNILALLIFLLSSFGMVTWASPLSNATTTTLTGGVVSKLRQEDGDVDEDVVTTPSGLQQVAGPIGQIVAGSLTGNIGQLFNGITGTVTNSEVQPGVGTILSSISNPLSSIWNSGLAVGHRYFNITTQGPLRATLATSNITTPVPTGAAISGQPTKVTVGTEAATTPREEGVVLETTPSAEEDDDDDEEAEAESDRLRLRSNLI